MKQDRNIHVLPTSNPSRLYLSDYGKELNLSGYPLRNYTTGKHIYITSDEEIKPSDYYLWKENEIIKANDIEISFHHTVVFDCKKIILTTDQDLIKDGVQAIDDEFLEWFVKNPSCEEVEVNKMRYGYLSGFAHAGYKIIIPKKNFYCGDKFDYDEQCLEQCDTCVDKKGVDYGYLPKDEQKKHLIDMMKLDEESGLYDEAKQECKDCNKSLEECTCLEDTIDFPRQEIKLEEVFNDDKKENIKKFIDEIQNPSEPNQALKDAAERILANNIDGLKDALNDDDLFFFYKGVVQCYGESMAKWIQEQNDTSKVRRVEVIQHSPPYNGRAFTKYNAKDVEIQFQDDGRTLKIFLK